jgi:hypothetical protein
MYRLKVITLAVMSVSLVALNAAIAGHDNNQLKWRDIIGIVDAGNVVGVGAVSGFTNGIPGGAPWSTLSGGAKVNLSNGKVQFEVKGLVLAAGSALGLTGLPIGTPGPISQVVGTLVCNVTGPGASEFVDTPVVALSATGDAQFSGTFNGTIPDACASDQFPAFLIRITGTGGAPPAGFDGVWIASGAVLDR